MYAAGTRARVDQSRCVDITMYQEGVGFFVQVMYRSQHARSGGVTDVGHPTPVVHACFINATALYMLLSCACALPWKASPGTCCHDVCTMYVYDASS